MVMNIENQRRRKKVKILLLKVRTESFDATVIQEVKADVIEEANEFQILET